MITLPGCLPASDSRVNKRHRAAQRCDRSSASGKPPDELAACVASHDSGEPDSVGKVFVNDRWVLIMKLYCYESAETKPAKQCNVVSVFRLKSNKSTYQR